MKHEPAQIKKLNALIRRLKAKHKDLEAPGYEPTTQLIIAFLQAALVNNVPVAIASEPGLAIVLVVAFDQIVVGLVLPVDEDVYKSPMAVFLPHVAEEFC